MHSTPEANARDPRRWLVLAVMSLGTLLVFLDLTVVNTALPAISLDLGASTADLQWVVDSYVVALAGLLILAGSIGDRYGRKNWLTVGLIVFGTGSVMAALAGSVNALIAGRIVQGVGAAFVLPATLSVVTNTFDREERAKAIAIWTAVGGMGIGFGPAVGGYLVEQWHWAAAFWIHVPIVGLALIGQLVVPDSRDPRRVGLDIPGSVTATVGVSALVFGIIKGAEQGWTAPSVVASLAIAGAALLTFIHVERSVRYPMLPLHLFRNRDFTGSVLVISIMFFVGPATFFFLSQFFQIVQGRSPLEAGLLILPNAGAIVVASVLGPRLARLMGPRRLVMLSVGIMTLAAALFTGVDAGWSAMTSIAVIVMFGFGFGLGMPSITDAVMAAVPVEDAGIGSAVNDVSRELGSALGVAVIGSFISSIYRGNIEERLAGQVPPETLASAKDGIGVIAAAAPSLPTDVATTALAAANQAFIDAMNTGFWLSTAVLALGVVVAAWLLPNESRAVQAQRAEVPLDLAPLETLRVPVPAQEPNVS